MKQACSTYNNNLHNQDQYAGSHTIAGKVIMPFKNTFVQIKISNILSVLVFIFSFGLLTAQEANSIPSGISLAIKTGNAPELSKYMNSTVEILLLDKEDFYKKNVAETILRDFFSEYQTKDFTIRHQGSRNDARYAIGNLITEKGNFRVYFLIKKVGEESLIHQIRIEPDNGN